MRTAPAAAGVRRILACTPPGRCRSDVLETPVAMSPDTELGDRRSHRRGAARGRRRRRRQGAGAPSRCAPRPPPGDASSARRCFQKLGQRSATRRAAAATPANARAPPLCPARGRARGGRRRHFSVARGRRARKATTARRRRRSQAALARFARVFARPGPPRYRRCRAGVAREARDVGGGAGGSRIPHIGSKRRSLCSGRRRGVSPRTEGVGTETATGSAWKNDGARARIAARRARRAREGGAGVAEAADGGGGASGRGAPRRRVGGARGGASRMVLSRRVADRWESLRSGLRRR